MFQCYEFEQGIDFDEFTQVHLKDDEISLRLDQVNKANAEGWTLLMYACQRGKKSLVEDLLNRGAHTNSYPGLKTPLMLAIGSGNIDIIQIVYNAKDLEVRDSRGWTALFYAVFYGQKVCAEFLLTQGANVNIVDNIGRSPTHIALKFEMESMVALLLTAKGTSPKTPIRQTPKAQKTSMFRKIRTFSPNSRPENKPQVKPEKHPTPKRPETTSERRSPSVALTPKTPVNETKHVLAFLSDLGLEKYWPIFRDEEIDFETLVTFHEENLKDIGIMLYGPRKKLLRAIQEYRAVRGGNIRLLKNSSWLN